MPSKPLNDDPKNTLRATLAELELPFEDLLAELEEGAKDNARLLEELKEGLEDYPRLLEELARETLY